MPIVVPVNELQPGQSLYRSFYNGDMVMLPAGKVLESNEIDSLQRRFPDGYLSIMDPVLDTIAEFEDDSQTYEIAAQVQQRLRKALATVSRKLKTADAIDDSTLRDAQRAIAATMDYMARNPVSAATLPASDNWQVHLHNHCANVFYLSVLIGCTIRSYVHCERERLSNARSLQRKYTMDLTPLAMASLFHDLGMMPLEELYGKTEPLTPSERKQVRRHPIAGIEMLPKDADSVMRLVIRTHHENLDGSGYPEGLNSDRLHIFARIIRVADAFDAATSPRVYKRATSAARALWEMTTGASESRYDPTVLKVFTSLIQPFPIGAKIQLDCGRYGVVMRHNRRQPFAPTIIIAFGEDGQPLPESQLVGPLDLAEEENVRLCRYGDDDLSFLRGDTEPVLCGADDEEARELFHYQFP
ncbi:MAG: HD domain-containing protein [Phycisphaerae bacterium]|nr:HD domain-containing protein [Phycisphaerae bacterium]